MQAEDAYLIKALHDPVGSLDPFFEVPQVVQSPEEISCNSNVYQFRVLASCLRFWGINVAIEVIH